MPSTPRQSSWIVTLSLAAIAVVYVALVWLPGHETIKKMRAEVETKQALVAHAAGLSTTLMAVKGELAKADSAMVRWEKNAPGRRDIPRLYGQIDFLAKNAHLAVSRFDPQPLVVHEKLQEIPIAINCSGTFAQVYEFLRSIEGLPMSIWVDSMRLETTTQTTQGVMCELSLVVFSNNL